MVSIRQRACDVTYAKTQQVVPATQTKKVKVPSVAFGDAGAPAQSRSFDVSDKGAADLDALLAQCEQRARQAYAPLIAIIEAVRTANGGGKKSEGSGAETEDPEGPDQSFAG